MVCFLTFFICFISFKGGISGRSLVLDRRERSLKPSFL